MQRSSQEAFNSSYKNIGVGLRNIMLTMGAGGSFLATYEYLQNGLTLEAIAMGLGATACGIGAFGIDQEIRKLEQEQ